MSRKNLITVVALGVALAGCATRDEPEFGSSVRHMVVGQTYDPTAPRDTVGPVDGQKATRAVDAYRAEKKSAKSQGPSAILVPAAQ